MDAESFGLGGKRALVTGAARGFGEAIAAELVNAGCTVVGVDVEVARGQQTAERIGARFLPCDVADSAQIRQLKQVVERDLGGIDILVNNAGIVSRTPFLELEEEEWERVVRVDFTSVFLMSKAFVPGMCDRRHGRVINISSLAEQLGGGFVGRCAYASAKGGVSAITRAMAKELAGFGVTVNGVAPGAMETEMTTVLLENPAILAEVVRGIPMGRRGGPDHVADTVLFLASDLASYITGQILNVDGGIRMK